MKLQISAGKLIVTPENYGDKLQIRKLTKFRDFFQMDIAREAEGGGYLEYDDVFADEADVIEFTLKQKGK